MQGRLYSGWAAPWGTGAGVVGMEGSNTRREGVRRGGRCHCESAAIAAGAVRTRRRQAARGS